MKRILAAILAIVMVVGLVPFSAFAADPHSHLVCGGTTCTDGNGHTAVTYTELSTTGGSLAAGNYYLTGDVTLSSPLNISGTVNLCLNGYDLIQGGTGGRVITIAANRILNLCDCGGTGTVTGGNTTGNGGGVQVSANSTFNLYGGAISGNTAVSGGGVYVLAKGIMNFYGGSVADNIATKYSGGGIYSLGTVNMYGGSITGNTATSGGGGIVNFEGTVNLYDGVISNNSAPYGGGVNPATNGTFNMSGGTITANTATGGGGGLYVDPDANVTITGGSITGNKSDEGGGVSTLSPINLSGAPNISGNTKSSSNAASNIFLDTDNAAAMIIVNGALTNTSPYGITMRSGTGTFAQPGGSLTDLTTYRSNFTSEEGYVIKTIPNGSNVDLELVVDHAHNACGDTTCSHTGTTHSSIIFEKLTLTGGNLAAGNWYLPGDVTLTSTLNITGTVNLCLNGYSLKYSGSAGSIIELKNGGLLNLCDCVGTGAITGGNAANAYGGGVYVNTNSTFNLYSGAISGNSAHGGGGVYVAASGIFNIYGGSIADNKATTYSGGGINNYGTVNMYGGSITGNVTTNSGRAGGGVFTKGAFYLHGGEISNNESAVGGGVCVSPDSSFAISGGTITGNTASIGGGGLYVEGEAYLTGGNITANKGDEGGGVCVYGPTYISGAPNISGNTKSGSNADSNIFLDTDSSTAMIIVDGALANTTPYGVSMRSGTGTFAQPGGFLTDLTPYKGNFVGEGGYVVKTVPNGNNVDLELVLEHIHNVCGSTNCGHTGSTHSSITYEKLYSTGGNLAAGNWYLPGDVTLTGTLNISGTVNLCLNGYTLKYGGTSGRVIQILNGGTLNLCDCQGTGKITGGKINNSGSGVHVETTGAFNMYGGSITGNDGTGGSGAGVFVKGTFNLYDGQISNNITDTYGGGVFVTNTGTFTMSGGTISGNTAVGGGGLLNMGTSILTGGSITANKGDEGGGVGSSGTLRLSGAPVISGNTKNSSSAPNNIYLLTNAVITVDGPLSNTSPYGVTMQAGTGTFALPGGVLTDLSGYLTGYFTSEENYTIVTVQQGTLTGLALAEEFTVEYDLDGGTGATGVNYGPEVVVDGTTVYVKSAPTKTDYKFLGYSDGVNTTLYQAGDPITVSGNMKLTAQWELDVYTVTYDLNGGTGATGISYAPEKITVGDNITVKAAPSLTNYDFLGYSYGGTLYQPGDTITVNSDVTLVAQWKMTEYTVTYNLDGGTGTTGVNYAPEKFPVGSIVTVKAGASKTNCNFLGYSDGTNLYQPGDTFTISGDVTLTAQWNDVTYTVKYELDGGTGATGVNYDPETVKVGTVITVKAAPSKTNYNFLGYSDGTNLYQFGDPITVSGDITLTAQWELIEYTVTYDLNGGTGIPGVSYDPEVVGSGSVITVKPAPTLGGYKFLGYSDGTNLHQPGNTITVTGDIDLVAQWEMVEYDVIYDLNGGTATAGVNYDPETVQEGTVITVKDAPARINFDFLGYLYDGKLYQPGDTITVNSDVTLVAQWEEITDWYTLSYDLNGGTGFPGVSYDPETYAAGAEATVKSMPTLEGYKFLGFSDGTTLYQPGQPIVINGDVTLVAQWEVEPPLVPASPYGCVVLLKVDAQDNTLVIPDTVFGLYRADGTLLGVYKTGSTGKIAMVELLPGSYYWQEIQPADGYVLDETKHVFEIVAGEITHLTVENVRRNIPAAFADDHFAYIVGYTDGTVRPEANITRAEVATIFFRLLKDEVRAQYLSTNNNFTDVEKGTWYNTAISTMTAMGILTGYPDGSFRPNANITRAEFATIMSRFCTNGDTNGSFFSDIGDHWAKDAINIVANRNWVTGYLDGTFRPDQNITRAEAMTMINRMLQRIPESAADLHPGMTVWSDNMDKTMWYYLAVQEATNSHDYDRKQNGYEYWTALIPTPDWTALERRAASN